MSDYRISPVELKAYLASNENIQLIDVRSPQEHQLFNIGGQVIPLPDLPKRLDELNKNKMIIIYCHSGIHSLIAVKILLDAGFTDVNSLSGGIVAWQDAEAKTQI